MGGRGSAETGVARNTARCSIGDDARKRIDAHRGREQSPEADDGHLRDRSGPRDSRPADVLDRESKAADAVANAMEKRKRAAEAVKAANGAVAESQLKAAELNQGVAADAGNRLKRAARKARRGPSITPAGERRRARLANACAPFPRPRQPPRAPARRPCH